MNPPDKTAICPLCEKESEWTYIAGAWREVAHDECVEQYDDNRHRKEEARRKPRTPKDDRDMSRALQ